jgi:hypothetical protein
MGIAPDAIEYLWDRLHELEPTSKLGGICAFKPGYHASRKENKANWPHDYSIQDSEDQGGDDDWCCAIDWTFPDAQAGHYATINKYSNRLMASGKDPNDDRLNNLREFFGNTDADVTTEGWDYRYVEKSTSSDNTHAWHIHISFDRKWANDRPTMDRLIAVLQGEDMATAEEIAQTTLNLDGIIDTPLWHPGHPTNSKIALSTAVEIAMDEAHTANVTAQKAVDEVAGVVTDVEQVNVKVDQILAILQAGVPIPGQVNLTPESVAAVANATADEIHADPERDGV